jgi:hypothetical protein
MSENESPGRASGHALSSVDGPRVRAPLRIAVLPALLLLATGCGHNDDRTAGGSPPTTSEAAAPVTVSRPQHAGGNLLNAAELELVSQQAVAIEPGSLERVNLSFDDAEAASVIVLTNKPKAVVASIEGERLQTGDLFGVPTFFINLHEPADSVLLLENNGETRAAASIEIRVLSDRKIELAVEPSAVSPGEPVKLTATVTEPTPEDVVHIRIVRDDRLVAELEPKPIATGEWQTTFRAKEAGSYILTARVDGGPPRFMSGVQAFSVADPGTRVGTFRDRLVDEDGDGRADYLSVKVDFVVSKPGYYTMMAVLGDEAGEPLRTGAGSEDRWLKPGRHSFDLRWHASSIRSVGLPGPWRIVNLQLIRVKPDYHTEADIRDLGATKAYPLSAFER